MAITNLGGMTPTEFAQKIKENYPQYKDVEDSLLIEKILKKYPQYREQINFEKETNQQEVKPNQQEVKPKGVKAEDSGELASSSAGIDSSLESKPIIEQGDPKRVKSPEEEKLQQSLAFPTETERIKQIESELAGLPAMQTNAKLEDELYNLKKKVGIQVEERSVMDTNFEEQVVTDPYKVDIKDKDSFKGYLDEVTADQGLTSKIADAGAGTVSAILKKSGEELTKEGKKVVRAYETSEANKRYDEVKERNILKMFTNYAMDNIGEVDLIYNEVNDEIKEKENTLNTRRLDISESKALAEEVGLLKKKSRMLKEARAQAGILTTNSHKEWLKEYYPEVVKDKEQKKEGLQSTYLGVDFSWMGAMGAVINTITTLGESSKPEDLEAFEVGEKYNEANYQATKAVYKNERLKKNTVNILTDTGRKDVTLEVANKYVIEVNNEAMKLYKEFQGTPQTEVGVRNNLIEKIKEKQKIFKDIVDNPEYVEFSANSEDYYNSEEEKKSYITNDNEFGKRILDKIEEQNETDFNYQDATWVGAGIVLGGKSVGRFMLGAVDTVVGTLSRGGDYGIIERYNDKVYDYFEQQFAIPSQLTRSYYDSSAEVGRLNYIFDTEGNITAVRDKETGRAFSGMELTMAKKAWEGLENKPTPTTGFNLQNFWGKTANGVADMAVLVYSGNILSRGMATLPVLAKAKKVNDVLGLTAAGMAMENPHLYREALATGVMTRNEANIFAGYTSAFVASLENISPNRVLLGKPFKKKLLKGYMELIAKGLPPKKAYGKALKTWLMSAPPEVLQELSQEGGNRLAKIFSNQMHNENIFDTEIKASEAWDITIATTATTLAAHSKAARKTYVDAKKQFAEYSQLEVDGIRAILSSKDVSSYSKQLDKLVKQEVITKEQAEETKNYINNLQSVKSLLDEVEISEEIKPYVAVKLAEKRNLELKKKNTDKAFHKEIDEKIAEIDKGIESLLSDAKEANSSRFNEDIEAAEGVKTQPTKVVTPEAVEKKKQEIKERDSKERKEISDVEATKQATKELSQDPQGVITPEAIKERVEEIKKEASTIEKSEADLHKQAVKELTEEVEAQPLGKETTEVEETKEVEETSETEITPETSSNYANMTEDADGNFVFFHRGKKGYKKVKKGTGQSKVTSREESAAVGKVGGVAMYYTDAKDTEKQGSDEAQYAVKVPKDKVYDFNSDPLNLIEEAEARHKEEHPNKAFDANTQVAYVTKIAGERGFHMVVSEWNGKTRAQTTTEHTPSDVKEIDGDVVTKEFKSKYKSNKDKGFRSEIPKTKNKKLSEVYDKIYKERNKDSNYDNLYHLAADSSNYSQEEITKMIEESDISQELKDEYKAVLGAKEGSRKSKNVVKDYLKALNKHRKDRENNAKDLEKGKISKEEYKERNRLLNRELTEVQKKLDIDSERAGIEKRDSKWDDKKKKSLPKSKFKGAKDILNTLKEGVWGMLTAENPNTNIVTDKTNKEANENAKKWLKERNYEVVEIFGKYGNSENSFFVKDLSREHAIEFAKKFKQESVATNEGLIYPDGSMNEKTGERIKTTKGGDMYSTINTAEGLVDVAVGYNFKEKVKPPKKKVEPVTPKKVLLEQVRKAKIAISKIAPKVKIKLYETTEEYRKVVGEKVNGKWVPEKGSGQWNPTNNTISINLEAANKRTVAHEVFHAVFGIKIGSDKKLQEISDRFIQEISKHIDPKVSKKLNDWVVGYKDKSVRSEEVLAELTGLLANDYTKLSIKAKSVIKKWLNQIAKALGFKTFTDKDIVDLLNTIATKTAKGEVIEEADLKTLNKIVSKDKKVQNSKQFRRKKEQAEGLFLTDKKPVLKSTKDVAIFLDSWVKENQLFDKDISELNADDVVDQLASHLEAELLAWDKVRGDEYISFYDSDINNKTNPILQKEAKKRYGRKLTDEELKLFHLVSSFASPNANPYMDSWKGFFIFDRYMNTGEISGFGDKIATVWKTNEKGNRVDTGVPRLDKEGKPSRSKLTPAYYQVGIESFNRVVSKTGGIKEAMDWVTSKHSFEEIAEMLDIPIKKMKKNEYINTKDGGMGIFGMTGAKLGSYVLNRFGNFSTVTKDMWYARTLARLTGETLTQRNKKTSKEFALKTPWAENTIKGREKRVIADKAFEKVADRLNTSPAMIQERIWDFEKRLYEMLGAGEDAAYTSDGLKKGIEEVTPRKQKAQISEVLNEEQRTAYDNLSKSDKEVVEDLIFDEQYEQSIGARDSKKPKNLTKVEQALWDFEEEVNKKALSFKEALNNLLGTSINKQKVDGELFAFGDEVYNIDEAVSIIKKEGYPKVDIGVETLPKLTYSFVTKTEEGIKNADIKKPVIIARTKDGLLLIDGHHRVAKAIREGKPIKAIILTKNHTNKIKLEGKRKTKSQISEQEQNDYDEFAKSAESSRDQSSQKGATIANKAKALADKALDEFVDRQGSVKKLFKKVGLDKVIDYMVTKSGHSAYAKNRVDDVWKNIYEDLSIEEHYELDEIILLQRIIAIDTNRAERGLEPVKHQKGLTKEKAERVLKVKQLKLGNKQFNRISNKGKEYFKVYKSLLKEMRDEQLITQESYELFAEVNYQPRIFLDFLEDMDNNILEKEIDKTERVPLSDKQIAYMKKGSEGNQLMDSWYLIQKSIQSRTASVFTNRLNRTFAEEYDKAKKEVEALKDKTILTNSEKKKLENFEHLKENIKEDEIVYRDGKPTFRLNERNTKGFRPVYYFVDGVKNRIFMKDSFHEKFTDTQNAYLSPDTKEAIATALGVKTVKTFATGNNPLFFITNTPRDLAFVLAFSEEYNMNVFGNTFKLMKDAAKGVKDVVSDSDNYKKYLEYGGGLDFLTIQGKFRDKGFSRSVLDAVIDKQLQESISKNVFTKGFSKIKKGLDKFNLASEAGIRLAVFNKAVENRLKGRDKADVSKEELDQIYTQAVRAARELTDFSQGGKITKALDAGIPYLNAATQGTRAAVNNMVNRPMETTARIAQLTAYSVGSFALAGLGAIALFRSEDEDEELTNNDIYFETLKGVSEYDLINYFIIPLGIKDEKGNWKYVRIAKAQALSPFLNSAEYFIRKKMAESSNIKYKQDLGDVFMKTTEHNILPMPLGFQDAFGRIPAATAYAALLGFDSYTGNPLDWKMGEIPSELEGLTSDRVQPMFKQLGQFKGDSPVRMQKAFESYFTTPSTNPYIGMVYGVGNLTGSNKEVKEVASDFGKDMYKSFTGRLLKSTSDYNKVAKLEEDMSKEALEIWKEHILTEHTVRGLIKDYKNEPNEEALIKGLVEQFKKDPDKAKRIVSWVKSEAKKKKLEPMVASLKFMKNKEVRALMLYKRFGNIFKKKFKELDKKERKLLIKIAEEKIMDEETMIYYQKIIGKE